jgi:hypothetical protein
MPSRPKGSSKTPGSGRVAGTPNRRTQEAQAVARTIVEDPAVQQLWLSQAKRGELSGTILQTLMYYAWGKPVEKVEHTGTVGHKVDVEVILE